MAKVEIEIERCKGCGLCVEVCPEQVLEIGREINLSGYQYVTVVQAEACIGCCRCAEMCPDTALAVWR
ncbi:MAG: 4Fe-4S dicluster domain-containing protein [Deltaproteobacteria bacterium]|nr:4Fe-4S dicluster domain-containing protein [Deltaproteobacteria bacterium]